MSEIWSKSLVVFMSSIRYSSLIFIKRGFSRQGLKKTSQISNFMKIRPVRAEFYYAERRTDGRRHRYDEANSLFFFCNLVTASRQWIKCGYEVE